MPLLSDGEMTLGPANHDADPDEEIPGSLPVSGRRRIERSPDIVLEPEEEIPGSRRVSGSVDIEPSPDTVPASEDEIPGSVRAKVDAARWPGATDA